MKSNRVTLPANVGITKSDWRFKYRFISRISWNCFFKVSWEVMLLYHQIYTLKNIPFGFIWKYTEFINTCKLNFCCGFSEGVNDLGTSASDQGNWGTKIPQVKEEGEVYYLMIVFLQKLTKGIICNLNWFEMKRWWWKARKFPQNFCI